MCVFFIFNLFLVSLGLCVDIYIVKRRRPRFVGGATEISLIDWLTKHGSHGQRVNWMSTTDNNFVLMRIQMWIVDHF